MWFGQKTHPTKCAPSLSKFVFGCFAHPEKKVVCATLAQAKCCVCVVWLHLPLSYLREEITRSSAEVNAVRSPPPPLSLVSASAQIEQRISDTFGGPLGPFRGAWGGAGHQPTIQPTCHMCALNLAQMAFRDLQQVGGRVRDNIFVWTTK